MLLSLPSFCVPLIRGSRCLALSPCLSNRMFAVHLQVGTRHKGRFVAGKVQRCVGHVVRVCQPAHRHVRHELTSVIRCVLDARKRGKEPCARHEGTDAVEANALWRVFSRKTLGSVEYDAFGRVIPHQTGSWSQGADRHNVDDRSALSSLDQVRNQHPASVQDEFDDENEHPIKLGLGDLHGRLVAIGGAGVVD
jgi:hypothetical protein